jgi:hypothetical protein
MIDERTRELINRELDGCCSEEESRELEAFLSENEEALQYYDELLRAASALKRVEPAEPPSFLKTHILNSIQALPHPERERMTLIPRIRELFRKSPTARYSVVFASGLALGILLLLVFGPWQQTDIPDVSKVSGSMVMPSDIARLQLIDSVALDGAGFRSFFRTLRGDGSVVLDCAVSSADNLRLELVADSEELKFAGVNRLNSTDNDLVATGGRVVFTGVKSEHGLITYTQVANPRQPIMVRIYKSGIVAGSVSVRTN